MIMGRISRAFALLLLTASGCSGLDSTAQIYDASEVDTPPELIGGIEGIISAMEGSCLGYRSEIEVMVIVEVVVDVTGSLYRDDEGFQHLFIVSGIGAGWNEEVLSTFREHAAFTTGRLDGTPVQVRLTIDVPIRLEDFEDPCPA